MIKIGTYRGMRPLTDPRFLNDSEAVYANNCWYTDGDLRSIWGLQVESSIVLKDGTKTIFPYITDTEIYWFSWTKEVDAVNSPIPNDPYQRVYFTGDGAPKYTRNDTAIGSVMPNVSYKLGIPIPEEAIQAQANTTVPEDPDVVDASNDESRLYVYTWVTSVGEEGPPSPISNEVVLYDPDIDTVDLILPPIGVNEQDIISRRIYRTATAGGTTDFYLVEELPVETLTYRDEKLMMDLGALLVTGNYFAPPEQMIGLTSLPNGVFAGFYDNVFCCSYPNLPYAWNPDYQLAFDSRIVAIAAIPSGAVVLTEDQPYIIQGYTPDSYSYMKLETSAACVSSRSVVDMGSSVIYASGRGLEIITSSEPQNLTIGIYSLEQWQALKPETFDAYEYKNKYVAFYDTGSKKGALIFDPAGGDVTECEVFAAAGFRFPTSEELYLSIDDVMHIFDADEANPLTFTWTSKLFLTPPYRYRACKARGEHVACSIIRNEQTIKTEALNAYIHKGHIFRVPKGRGHEWQVQFSGTGWVRDVQLVMSKREAQ